MKEKVIALIDMDCFYVQVEARENPAIRGVPAAVVQYKTWKGGGIIAVNYEARAMGVTRQMRGDEAREKCPDIVLVRVPEVRDKADLTKYRKAGREVIEVLVSFGAVVERASIDEAYLDLTPLVETRMQSVEFTDTVLLDLPNTHLGGSDGDRQTYMSAWLDEVRSTENDSDRMLAVGASIIEEMREAVYSRTQFRCSAGIAHCKTLAKLCCGLNKPNKQTILPISAVPTLYSTLKVTKVRGLGGKLGESVTSALNVQTMGQLAQLSLRQINDKFDEKTANWLHSLAKGYDGESVTERELAKSIGCGKNFRGPDILDTKAKVELRLRNLVEELVERLEVDREENCRLARGVTVGTNLENQGYVSRAGQLFSYSTENVYRTVYGLLSKLNTADLSGAAWEPKLLNISISASKFEDLNSTLGNTQSITTFFKKKTQLDSTLETSMNSTAGLNATFDHDTTVDQKVFYPAESDDVTLDNIDNHDRSAIARVQLCTHSKIESPKLPSITSSGSEPQPKQQSFFRRKMQEMAEEERRKRCEEQEQERRKRSEEEEQERISRISEQEQSISEPSQQITTGPELVKDRAGEIDMAELIPSLADFDQEILGLLPLNVRSRAKDRIEYLKKEKEQQETSEKAESKSKPSGSGKTIDKYLTESQRTDKTDLELCHKCHKMISSFELPEHLDYHFAKELREEQILSDRNAQISNRSATKGKEATKSVKKGGKRKRQSDACDDTTKKQKDITSFFNKK